MNKKKLLWIDDMLVGDSCLRKTVEQVEGILYAVPEDVEIVYSSQHSAKEALQQPDLSFIILSDGAEVLGRAGKQVAVHHRGLVQNLGHVINTGLPFVVTSMYKSNLEVEAENLIDIKNTTEIPIYLNRVFKEYF